MIPPGVVKSALFRRAANAAGSYLRDVDVGVFFRGVVDVFVDGEGDGGVGYGFAEEPGYALLVARSDGEVVAMKGSGGRLPVEGYGHNHRIGICSEGKSVWEEVRGLEERTIVHTPLRSWSVRSDGAAIVGVCRDRRRNSIWRAIGRGIWSRR